MAFRHCLSLALIVGATNIAAAQFTTFIPPQKKIADSVTAAVAQQKAKTDSIVNTQLTNMKTWVDSAAGVPAPPPAIDTLANAPTAPESTTAFVSGTRAPATASWLPLLALVGAVSLLLGTFLLAGGRSAGPPRNRA